METSARPDGEAETTVVMHDAGRDGDAADRGGTAGADGGSDLAVDQSIDLPMDHGPDQTQDTPVDRGTDGGGDADAPMTVEAGPDVPDVVTRDGDAGDGDRDDGDTVDHDDADTGDGGDRDAGDAQSTSGCASSVDPTSLSLWLAADVGVECDPLTNRVTSWRDRAIAGRSFKPATGHMGPLCGAGAALWNGRQVPVFDRSGTSDHDQDSVLPVDLSSLIDSDYTVMVVERRQSAAVTIAYPLGTDVPSPDTETFCGSDDNNHMTYRFGYRDGNFSAGDYGVDDNGDCSDIAASVPMPDADPPLAHVDVEVFSKQRGRSFFYETTPAGTNPNNVAIQALLPGQYLGRAYQHFGTNDDGRFDGQIAEVIIFHAALADQDRLTITQCLMQRWGF